MRCAATAKWTEFHCGKKAQPGRRYCRFHSEADETRSWDDEVVRNVTVPDPGIPAGDPPSADLADSHDMGGEIALLRRRIREAADEGDWEAMRKGIETLCKVLKVQYVLQGRSSESLAGSISRVLEEVGNELGMTL